MDSPIQNYNIAIQSNFKLVIPNALGINYFLQSCNLPSVSMEGIQTDFRNNQALVPGNQVMFTPLECTAIMDEDYKNYIFLHEWLSSFIDQDVWRELTKDIKLHILSANKHSLLIFTLVHAWPTSIGEVSFTSSSSDSQEIVFPFSLAYQYFDYEVIDN